MSDAGRHPTRDELQAFLSGALPPRMAASVERHLAVGCPGCEQVLDELERTVPQGPAQPAPHELETKTLDPAALELPGALVGQALGDGGRYLLTRYLGSGSFGEVYRADDQRFQAAADERVFRQVAVKVSRVGRALAPQDFLREAQNLALLRHSAIVQVYDFGRFGQPPRERYFLVCELVDGVDLRTRVKELHTAGQRMPRDKAVALVAEIAEALHHAHTRGGLVHRDIKPSNILVDADGHPKIIDFGLGLRREDYGRGPLSTAGTIAYMSPEQALNAEIVDGRSDIYGLGVILYELLTGWLPFRGTAEEILKQLRQETASAAPLRQLEPTVLVELERICLKAISKRPEARYQVAGDFAADLRRFLVSNQPREAEARRPTASGVRFEFVGRGATAPVGREAAGRLYLDVGNDLRPGVIDHHHLAASGKSTVGLVLANPDLLAPPDLANSLQGLTVVTHSEPDLDAIASVYVALEYLRSGRFPPAAESLARYADRVDMGYPGMSQRNPFTLYAALLQLLHRLTSRTWNDMQECWRQALLEGIEVVAFVLERASATGKTIGEIDAFGCPGMFSELDRRWVRDDLQRYRHKLAQPETHARSLKLTVPGQFGGTQEVDALLVRGVQNPDDPDRCMFFKDWARTDPQSPGGTGYVVLCIVEPESSRAPRRGTISVNPASQVSLEGLGQLLEEAESEARRELGVGIDDRLVEPLAGTPQSPRPGYASADPWYDGRAHAYTIVDSPRSGTRLTADEIEAIVLDWGSGPRW